LVRYERSQSMSEIEANAVRLYYELHGSGEPLVLVHGSWGDAGNWRFVVPGLAESFRVLVYDRRGHSRSERPEAPGSVDEDGDDLAALLEALDLAPAHVVTNSFGGNIALRLATRRPEVFRTLSCHEPPLWSLLEDDPASQAILGQGAASDDSVGRRIADGDHEGAARQFLDEVAFGPGACDKERPAERRSIFIQNAPTYLDELRDPEAGRIDPDLLSHLEPPARLREPANISGGGRTSRETDPARDPGNDPGRWACATGDHAGALRRGHDARAATGG
jgi:pimeloyl-ACP methyl ester carboxylesterase